MLTSSCLSSTPSWLTSNSSKSARRSACDAAERARKLSIVASSSERLTAAHGATLDADAAAGDRGAPGDSGGGDGSWRRNARTVGWAGSLCSPLSPLPSTASSPGGCSESISKKARRAGALGGATLTSARKRERSAHGSAPSASAWRAKWRLSAASAVLVLIIVCCSGFSGAPAPRTLWTLSFFETRRAQHFCAFCVWRLRAARAHQRPEQ